MKQYFEINERTLVNGMRLCTIDKKVKQIIIAGSVEFSVDERGFPIGISHLCEHLNFYKNKENVYNKFTDCGCLVNAITNHYGSVYYGDATYNFEQVLDLMLELLLKKTKFTSAQYKNELRIVASEIETFGENKPNRKICQFYENNFGDSQYLFPIVGDKSILRMESKNMVEQGFIKFYIPQRISLYIGGKHLDIAKLENYVNTNIKIKSYDR